MPVLLAAIAALFLVALPGRVEAAAGQIRVTVRNDFSTAVSGATVVYSCGSGEQTVADQSGTDQDSAVGIVLIQPSVPAACDANDPLTVTVNNLGTSGYLNWQGTGIYTTGAENSFTTVNRFSLLVNLTDEFGAPASAASAAGSWSGASTVGGVLSADQRQIGFPVPVGGSDGTLTVTGMGALGLVDTILTSIALPQTSADAQRVQNSNSKFSIFVLGRDQFGQPLQGLTGGSATFQSSSQISCANQSGTPHYGCRVPVGSGASTIRVSHPGYADYTSGSAAPPATGSGTQTAVQTANLYTIKVLGVADEFGVAVTPTSTPSISPPFLASGTNIIATRWSGNEWYVAATPGSVQLTIQVNGYANMAVRVEVSAAGQALVDYDGASGATWSANVDGPAVPADMYVTLYDTNGLPVPNATMSLYRNTSYASSALASDLRIGAGANASRQSGSDGTAKFALPTGSYWVQIVASGIVSWGSAADPKVIGFIESGGPYRYTLRLGSGGPTAELTSRSLSVAAVSPTRSTIVAVPGATVADGVSALTVTVTARDEGGNILPGRTVTVASSRGATDAWNATVGTTDDTGAAVFTVRSTTAGSATLTATIDGVALSAGAAVSFTMGEGSGLLYAPGTLLKLACPSDPGIFDRCRAVYHYGADAKRHPFPNDKIYRTWFSDFSNIAIIGEATMAAIPLGPNVRYRPGARLVKVPSVPDVFALERGGILRKTVTEAVAAVLYGSAWLSLLDDINEAFFGDYTRGTDITDASSYSPSAARDGTTTIEQEQGR